MSGAWVTRGFEGFRQGEFGNAGHNLYVSRQGVLQRIHQYDLDGDGHLDLVLCNSQNHWERPPAYVYADPLGRPRRMELPCEASRTAAVADLNGDGCDDLVLGMWHNGIRGDLCAVIYYGSPQGFSERYQQQLPAPMCSAIAAGDFDGDGRTDLAFLCHGRLRVFYQTELGFEPRRYADLDIAGDQLAAADLDGDGSAELVVRLADGEVRVYWGGAGGLEANRFATVPAPPSDPQGINPNARYTEYVPDASPLVQVLRGEGVQWVFVARAEAAFLVAVEAGRRFGPALRLTCGRPMAAALGDVNGDGYADLVLACREPVAGGECSWIYWGGPQGFDAARRTPLPSRSACDVAVVDLNGDGCAEIALCQPRTEESYTSESLVYRGRRDGVDPEVRRLPTEDARRVLVARPSGADPHLVFTSHFSRNALGNIPVSVYLGGPEGFTPERRLNLPAWGAVEAVCGDLDDDGRADLVLANAAENSIHRDPGSHVYLNSAQGLGLQPAQRLPTTRAHGVCCADLDRDGYLDLVFCGFDNPEILVFHGTADGFDTAHPERLRLEHEGVVYKEPRWIYLADLNHDGWLDLVVPQIEAERSFILWGGPQGFSMSRCQTLSVARAACCRAADLDGDGYLDLVVGGHIPSADGPHDTFLYVYWNGPDGLREDRRSLLPAYGANALAIADFNNDGSLDLFACSYHDGRQRDIPSYLYWNRPGRGFAAADCTRLFTHSASGCVAGDFNEDGWIDLAIAYHKIEGDHLGHSAVWWNGPDGFSANRVTRLPSAGPHGMTAVGPGNLMDRGPEEYYTSIPFRLPAGQSVQRVSWEAEVPAKAWVKAQLRFAPSREDLDRAPWLGPSGSLTWADRGQAWQTRAWSGHWLQYRLAVGARHSGLSPRVRSVAVEYG